MKNLRKVMEEVLRPENFCVSYTGERESLDVVKAQAAGIKKVLFNGQKPESVKQAPCIKNPESDLKLRLSLDQPSCKGWSVWLHERL